MLWNVVLVEAKRRRKIETSGVGPAAGLAWLMYWFDIGAAGEGRKENLGREAINIFWKEEVLWRWLS